MAPQDEQPINEPRGHEAQSGFDKLGQEARVEAGMLKDDQPLDPQSIDRILTAARDYIAQRKAREPKYSLTKFCAELGTLTTGRGETKRASEQVISQVLSGKYHGSMEPYVRRIDALLARERLRGERMDLDEFVDIELARRVRGVVHAAKVNSSIGVVIMHPGEGKTTIAEACARLDSAALMITIGQGEGTEVRVRETFYDALQIPGARQDPARRRLLMDYIAQDRTLLILVDEAQRLQPAGLEFLRTIHDNADSKRKRSASHKVPIVLFGDHDFYRLIQQGRRGGGRVKPQMVRRMYPFFDSDTPGAFKGRPKGREYELYGVDDLVKILRNERLRLVTGDGIQFLARLANIRDYGALGTAVAVTRLAYTMSNGRIIDVRDLKRALRMMLTERVGQLLIDQIEADLAKEEKVAAAATA